MNYIISSSMVPAAPYLLGDGVKIQAVVPQARMYEFGMIPHRYESVIALTTSDDMALPEAYNLARNLAVFHSFAADDPEVFQCAVEKGIKNSFLDSELQLLPKYPRGMDFDRFPLSVPMLTKPEEQIPPNYKEVMGLNHPYPWECSYNPASYNYLFKKFCEFENSTVESEVLLHGQMCSYVFIRSIWDISNVGLLYKNENLSAMFHVAILESIVGNPPFCEGDVTCPDCLKRLDKHYSQTWQEHLTNELNRLEMGWGDAYAEPIHRSRSRRHLFAHGAAYSDLTQEFRKLYDKSTYYGQDLTEEDSAKENHLANEENNLSILERTVRKLLVTRFLNMCGIASNWQ